MEAILLAGGQAKRLGDVAEGLPKALVPVAGAPLASYTTRLLASAGVDRLIVSCAAGQGEGFERALGDLGPSSCSRRSRSGSDGAAGCGSPPRSGARAGRSSR